MKVSVELSEKQVDRLLSELNWSNLIKQEDTLLLQLEQSIQMVLYDWFIQRDYWKEVSEAMDTKVNIMYWKRMHKREIDEYNRAMVGG